MEDIFSVAYQQTDDEKDLEYAFFGIFDGHGGREAAQFAKDNLMEHITKNSKFWSDDDQTVLKAIREGFLETQKAMWADLPNWRKTASGLPSTAGTTASICFIKRGKLFIGHVGDSGIILGERDPLNTSSSSNRWRSKRLTRDHKPEEQPELSRIEDAGGKVVSKSGVPRVVWYRPSGGHTGPIRRSTHIDEVPFLAVARALGDLWSYNSKEDVYVVSPDPDLHVYDLNILKDRCLVLFTDGISNVVNPEMAVHSVFEAERNNEQHMIDPNAGHTWINPSKKLVDLAINRWTSCNLRADNSSVVTVMLDPPGPPRAQVLRKLHTNQTSSVEPAATPQQIPAELPPAAAVVPQIEPPSPQPPKTKGIAIISRYPNSTDDGAKIGNNLIGSTHEGGQGPTGSGNGSTQASRIVHDSTKPAPKRVQPIENSGKPPLQCNEVTSSDDETNTTPPVPKRSSSSANMKAKFNKNKSLNRELAALQQDHDGKNSLNDNNQRTRRQSGPPLPPLPSRRSIIPHSEDSDAENNLPNHRQAQKVTLVHPPTTSGSGGPGKPHGHPKTPEVSPRILRSRNTPTPLRSAPGQDRKRQRPAFEPVASVGSSGISSKMKKTAVKTVHNSATLEQTTNSRVKCLRSRMN